MRTCNQRRADLELLCASGVGRLPLGEITRGQFTRALDHVADHNGLTRADRVLSAAKTLLTWHAARSDYVPPLGRGGRRTSTCGEGAPRILQTTNCGRVWMTAARKNGPFGPS